jgi:hypothetical protein
MSASQATAEVFLTALKAMSKKEQSAVLAGIVQDKNLREDLLDLALIAKRRNESSRSFRQYLAGRKK